MICAVEGCELAVDAKGFCRRHYGRWRRHGDPLAVRRYRLADGPRPECSVEGCARVVDARGLCRMHYKRWRRNGDPVAEPEWATGPEHPLWRGDEVAYSAIHYRLRQQRGSARKHRCRHCGKAAREWAYDHQDPDERVCPKVGCVFSLDLGHYLPLCSSCHKRFDREVAS